MKVVYENIGGKFTSFRNHKIVYITRDLNSEIDVAKKNRLNPYVKFK